MRRPARRAWLVLGITVAMFGWVPRADAQPTAVTGSTARPTVVLVAVPGLLWSDVEYMPELRRLASQGSVAELSVKTAGGLTRCAAAMLAVSAGNRTGAPISPCSITPAMWPALRTRNAKSIYNAKIGSLGDALQAAHIPTVAVTSDARPMLANSAGMVDHVVETLPSAFAIGGVVAILDQSLYLSPQFLRGLAQDAVDSQLVQIDSELPPNAVLMVAGIGDQHRYFSRLHAIVISGPGWPHRQLTSPIEGRAPYVQTIDIAPTILSIEGVPVPNDMVGRPMAPVAGTVPSIGSFVDDNRHAVGERILGQRVFLTLGIVAIVLMLLAAAPVGRAHTLARWLARILAPAPVFLFIANAFPWWRWGQSSYAGIVLGGSLLLAAATTIVGRRNQTAGLLLVPVFSMAVLAIDQLTGATLQTSAPIGDSPIVAGRFSGMGNLDFAVWATSAMLVAAVVGARLPRLKAVLATGAIAGFAVVIDGAPQLGNDIGGVLSLLPAAIIVVALVARVRITKRRAALVAVTTVVVAVLVAVADYSRPASKQTHVGRFVGQVLHGGAWTEVHRKLIAATSSIGLTIGTFVVAVALVLAVLARNQIRAFLATSRGISYAVVAITVAAVLGVALNDSGITIAAMAIIVGVSAIYGAGVTGEPLAASPSIAATEPAQA